MPKQPDRRANRAASAVMDRPRRACLGCGDLHLDDSLNEQGKCEQCVRDDEFMEDDYYLRMVEHEEEMRAFHDHEGI